MAEHEGSTAEVTGLFSDEALLQRRLDLHHDLGRISAALCEAQLEYNACITDILKTNDELRQRGIDTSVIEAQLRHPLHHAETA
jgi:hypothetical protein